MDQFQNTEPTPSSSHSLFEMNLDAQNSYNLRSSASWAKVLGVVGIITGAVLVIWMGIAMSQMEGSYGYRSRGFNNMFYTRTGLWIIILTGIIFIVGGIFSFNSGNKINQALKSNDQNGLNAGFAALRNYFALRAIVVIIFLLLLLVILMGTM